MKNKILSISLQLFYVLIILVFLIGGYYFYTDLYTVYLVDKEVTIDIGNLYQIELLPKNSKYFSYDNYVFSVEDNSIINVNNFGELSSLREGDTKVTVRFKNGIEKETLNVKVKNIEVSSLDIEKDFILRKNSSKRIITKVNNQYNIITNLTYISENEKIATVDSYGNVTGKREGKTNIIVRSNNNIEKQVKVTVKASNEKIQDIGIEEETITLKKGKTKQLNVVTVPSDASTRDLKWTSSDPSVATVDSDGVVTALSKGYAVISTMTPSRMNAQASVYVEDAEEIILNKYNIELEMGQSTTLSSNKTVTYKTEDNSVATVDQNGTVTGIKEGKTNIIVSTSDGNQSVCEVIVKKKKVQIENISLNKNNVNMVVGDTLVLVPNIDPSDAYNNITWKSGDSKIATVDQNGKVTALKEGKTTITVISDNGVKDTCIISIKNDTVNKIEIDRKDFEIDVGSSITLNVIFTPTNTTNKKITWTSDDSSIAKVNQNGTVTGLKEGTTTITAKSSNNLTSSVKVTVIKNTVDVSSISLNYNSINIGIDESTTLTATIMPTNASIKTITWTSDNNSIAKVNQDGTVTGLKEGTTIITATTNNGKTAKCNVIVKSVEVKSISLNTTSTSVNIGTSINLTATISPDNSTNKSVTWTSSDPSVATVDSNGKVTGIKVGSAVITATTNNGKTAKCTITVNSVAVKSISLNKSEINIAKGSNYSLSVTFEPNNATDKRVTWTSSDPSVATVDSNGKVTGIKEGFTKIIVTSVSDKSIKSEALVNVKSNSVDVISISLNKTSASVCAGDTLKLVATINPSDATNKSVTWTSSDTKIATVDSNGNVKGVSVGTATITAKTSNNKTASATINVIKKQVDVTSIKINTNVNSMYVMDTIILSATINPDNATNKKITWTSNATSIATVDSNGKVTALKSGSVTITATSNSNPKVSDSKTIIINEKAIPVTSLKSSVNNYTLQQGESYSWKVTVSPSNATNKQIIYSSSNNSVATVDSNGIITAKSSSGSATITAKSKENNSIKTTIKIDVEVSPIAANGRINNDYFGITPGDTDKKSVALKNSKGISEALAYASAKGIKKVSLDRNTYVVANNEIEEKDESFYVAIQMSSNVVFDLNNSVIQLLPNTDPKYSVIFFRSVENAEVRNGKIVGDRKEHRCYPDGPLIDSFKPTVENKCGDNHGKNHEHGMGISIIASRDIKIYDLSISYMTGDGIYMRIHTKHTGAYSTENITIDNNRISKCRRQGISIISGNNIEITNNVIHDIHGTAPQLGIDLEPNQKFDTISNVKILNNTIYDMGNDKSIGAPGQIGPIDASTIIIRENLVSKPVCTYKLPCSIRNNKKCDNNGKEINTPANFNDNCPNGLR